MLAVLWLGGNQARIPRIAFRLEAKASLFPATKPTLGELGTRPASHFHQQRLAA